MEIFSTRNNLQGPIRIKIIEPSKTQEFSVNRNMVEVISLKHPNFRKKTPISSFLNLKLVTRIQILQPQVYKDQFTGILKHLLRTSVQ